LQAKTRNFIGDAVTGGGNYKCVQKFGTMIMMLKNYAKLSPLPLGAITARGWLREQLLRNRDGMGGHLDELEPQMLLAPYTTKKTDDGWGDVKTGWGAEISGNYWLGVIKLAFTLNDPQLIDKVTNWVGQVLKNVDPDGYLGAYQPEDDRQEDYNAWGTAGAMRALLDFAEAADRADVFTAVYNCMLWFTRNWSGDRKTRYAGPAIIDPMMRCYHRTGDKRLLDFCVDYLTFLDGHDLYMNSVNAYADPKLLYNSNHTVAYVTHVRAPALVYAGNGDRRLLEASANGIAKLRARAMHATGAPVCNNEYLAPVSLYAESEYCSFTLLGASYAAMTAVTGDTVYGDYLEELAFNAAQGARMNSERAIQYNSPPNQIYATINSSHFHNVHSAYAPIHPVSCCAVNSIVILPEFVSHLAFTDPEGNLHLNAYAPCSIRHHGATLTTDTLYPFRNTVTYTVHTDSPQRFAVFPKRPNWCRRCRILVNGEPAADLRRDWRDGDTFTLLFETEPQVTRVHDFARNEPLTIRYGALNFVYPIPENWVNIGNGCARTPLPSGWAWYEVLPVFNEPPSPKYEQMGHRKEYISWNIALAEKELAIEVEEIAPEGYVWERPPIRLRVRGAYKAPFAYAPYPGKTSEVYEPELDVTHPVPLELVPYGCTALRITYFPRASDSAGKNSTSRNQ